MRNKHFVIGLLWIGLAVSVTKAGGLETWAQQALSENSPDAAAAIENLRAAGPAGLAALLEAGAATLRQYEKPGVHPAPEGWPRLNNALNAVGAQYDCEASRLYWYTDLAQAQAAARAGGKPILSLRLLGKLDEEYSCANSRFFRTTLYANASVSAFLRDHFILHWKSERPVPRITIDFGDGRKIERTIAGNSIHYILDADGRLIDALPGLYGPAAFLKGLADANEAAVQSATFHGETKEQFLRKYHSDHSAAIAENWGKEIQALGTPVSVTPQTADENTWLALANRHASDARLDPDSRRLIQRHNPTLIDAARVAVSKSVVETPLNIMVMNLQRGIAEDTVRNEYLLHSQIHQWLGASAQNLESFNSRVYASLFLTPESDPWLGLAPANTYTALDHNGLVQTSTR